MALLAKLSLFEVNLLIWYQYAFVCDLFYFSNVPKPPMVGEDWDKLHTSDKF